MKYLTLNLISTLRFLTNPRPVYRLKRNTLFRLTLIVLIGSAGLSACANFDRSDDYLTALRAAAEQGDAQAQFNLGVMYATGWRVPQDDKAAVQWYARAAEQGNAHGQFNLGRMYQYGKGVQQDDELAVKWYELAAKQGDADAQYALSEMYRKGKGVPQDDELADQWLARAAKQEHFNAKLMLLILRQLQDHQGTKTGSSKQSRGRDL